jgi:hypothetical protein
MANRTVSPRPKLRPGSSRATSPRPKLRPKKNPNMYAINNKMKRDNAASLIGDTDSGSTRGVDPADNYSAEDLLKLLGSAAMGGAGGLGLSAAAKAAKKVMGKKNGGKVRAYANGGAVMSGRGPKFKGQS